MACGSRRPCQQHSSAFPNDRGHSPFSRAKTVTVPFVSGIADQSRWDSQDGYVYASRSRIHSPDAQDLPLAEFKLNLIGDSHHLFVLVRAKNGDCPYYSPLMGGLSPPELELNSGQSPFSRAKNGDCPCYCRLASSWLIRRRQVNKGEEHDEKLSHSTLPLDVLGHAWRSRQRPGAE